MKLSKLLVAPLSLQAFAAATSIDARASRNLAHVEEWFTHFNTTLTTLQTEFWNGQHWPILQWIEAFLGTLTSASIASYTDFQQRYADVSTYASNDSIFPLIEAQAAIASAHFEYEDVQQIYHSAYDDVQWVVFEWLQGLNNPGNTLAQNQTYAHRAHIFYNVVQDKFDTSTCDGGMTWNPTHAVYKNSVTNELFISSSMDMYRNFPGDDDDDPGPFQTSNVTLPRLPNLSKGDPIFLDNAKKAHDWMARHHFLTSEGLIADGYHLTPDNKTCGDRQDTMWTYNQAIILSGFRDLWEVTGIDAYLDEGIALILNMVKATELYSGTCPTFGCGGVMAEQCDAAGTCWPDHTIYKGIYFYQLSRFCQPVLPGNALLNQTSIARLSTTCAQLIPWIELNARAALGTINDQGLISGQWMPNALPSTRSHLIQIGPGTHASGVCVVKAALDFNMWYGT